MPLAFSSSSRGCALVLVFCLFLVSWWPPLRLALVRFVLCCFNGLVFHRRYAAASLPFHSFLSRPFGAFYLSRSPLLHFLFVVFWSCLVPEWIVYLQRRMVCLASQCRLFCCRHVILRAFACPQLLHRVHFLFFCPPGHLTSSR